MQRAMSDRRGQEPSVAGDDALAALLRHESDVARAWLAAVVGAQALDEIASLPLAELAGDAVRGLPGAAA